MTDWVTTSGFWISHDDECGGEVFWHVQSLTDDQYKQLSTMTDIVAAIEPDGQVKAQIMLGNEASDSYERKLGAKRLLRKRDDLSIQQYVPPDLAYISNPRGSSKAQPDYYFLTDAGEGITIYLVEQGVEEVKEFTTNSVIQRWLFTNGATRTKSDDSPSGHGTCVASKISGLRYGVIKHGNIVSVN